MKTKGSRCLPAGQVESVRNSTEKLRNLSLNMDNIKDVAKSIALEAEVNQDSSTTALK
jgi:hypothetical protein